MDQSPKCKGVTIEFTVVNLHDLGFGKGYDTKSMNKEQIN